MKELIKQWIFLYGLIMIFATIVPAILDHQGNYVSVMAGMLGISLMICLINYIIEKIALNNMLLIHVIRLTIILILVYGFGWFLNWYALSSWWTMACMVLPVYFVYYLIDCIQTKKDIDDLNKQLKMKNER